jgi:hypothetical protein
VSSIIAYPVGNGNVWGTDWGGAKESKSGFGDIFRGEIVVTPHIVEYLYEYNMLQYIDYETLRDVLNWLTKNIDLSFNICVRTHAEKSIHILSNLEYFDP